MDMSGLARQAQQMQKKMEKIEADLKERVVEGTAGGGVSVKCTGGQEIVDVKIDPKVINPDDKALLEDMIIAAVNEALRKAKKLRESEMAKVMGGMSLPGMI